MGTAAERDKTAPGLLKLRVLLVDDDQEDSLIFEKKLAELNEYEVDFTWTNDFEDALQRIRDETYDIHFVDYRLAGRSGLELVARVLDAQPTKNFVLVTGFGDDHVETECLRRGATGYLPKSRLTPAHLRRCMLQALAPRKTHKPDFPTGHLFDGLTGAYHIKTFLGAARQELEAERGTDVYQALMILDVDRFADVQRTHGKDNARRKLQTMAEVVRSRLTRSSMIGRYGEDKLCILTQLAHFWMAEEICEHLRAAVERLTGMTVSIGVALATADRARLNHMLSRADEAKRTAQSLGRNRVEIWKD